MEKKNENEKICMKCKNFTMKLMLNGYHGICNKKPLEEMGFVRLDWTCEDWNKGE